MTLYTIQETGGQYTVKENGIPPITVSSQKLVDAYIKARQDINQHGEAGAHQKWWDEEAKERRKLGLPVKADYTVTHYGTSTKAKCGVHKGVQGDQNLEVMDHTLDPAAVTCPECLEA